MRPGGHAVAGVALALLASCSSSKALIPDAAVEAGAPDGMGGEASPTDLGADRTEAGRCGSTNDRAVVELIAPDGEELSCERGAADGGVGAPRTWAGVVTASTEATLVVDVDQCETDGGCEPLRIEAHAPGLDLRGFPHVAVQVSASFRRFFGCTQSLEIRTASGQQLLLAVVDGGGPISGSLYSVDRVRLGCSSELGCGNVPPDDYAFEFNSGSVSARVYMGETTTMTFGSTPLRVRNLRSYQGTACDDYWNFAYTISPAP
jgi:hypothetical protein